MKTVRLTDDIVSEVIPEYALPVSAWYGEEFASQCREAPDEVDQHWQFDKSTSKWLPPAEKPVPSAPPPDPTPEERIAEMENALCEQDSANAQQMAEIENALCQLDMAGKGV